MDQDVLVKEQTEAGRQLIEALAASGFAVRIAFWAKPSEAGKWYLYLASPFVDEKGPLAAYRSVHALMRNRPDSGIDPLAVKVIGLNDSVAEAALAKAKPEIPDSPFAVPNPKPYPGATWLGATTLGGVGIDGAYIYPPRQPAVSA